MAILKAFVCPAVSATEHIKDPVPLVKSRASCGRFTPSFIQVM